MDTIKILAQKMINGDFNAEEIIKKHYKHYIKQLINDKYTDPTFNKQDLTNAGLEGLEIAITLYKQKNIEYSLTFSSIVTGYIRKRMELESKRQLNNYEKIIQQYANKLFINDKIAKKEIFDYYENYITELCKQKVTSTVTLEDLKQICYIALIKAINLYRKKPTGYFSTVACTYIRAELERFFENENKYINLEKSFPKMVEIPDMNNVSDDIINTIDLDNALNSLKPTHKDIVILYFYNQYTLDQIAKIYGVSHQRINEIITNSLIKLRYDLTGEKQEKKHKKKLKQKEIKIALS